MKAFPSTEPIYGNNIVGVKQSTGMELRDYFASKAMQALVSNPKLGMNPYDEYAICAYKYADAMMEAREK